MSPITSSQAAVLLLLWMVLYTGLWFVRSAMIERYHRELMEKLAEIDRHLTNVIR